MSKASPDSTTAEELADFIAREALMDGRRMEVLHARLDAALDDFQSRKDGGLLGAIQAVDALKEYLVQKTPDWTRKGLLNPILETLATLRALNTGGTSNILKSAPQRNRNQKSLTENELFYRGAVAALVDAVLKQRRCSLEIACSQVARELRAQRMPVGMKKSSDSNTIMNWRKKASGGALQSDMDTKAYFITQSGLAQLGGLIDIPAFVTGISGIRPPGNNES